MCKEQSKPSQYKDDVLLLLNSCKKGFPLTDGQLNDIQLKIEDLTMSFDEKSVFKSCPTLIKMLISDDYHVSAKDFLMTRVKSDEDIKMLSVFDQYTIEAIIVYVICQLFTSDTNTDVRIATLVDQLERNVRSISLLMRRNKSEVRTTDNVINEELGKNSGKKLEKQYHIGTSLVELMIERGMITLSSEMSRTVPAQKKQGSYYLPSSLNVLCNFDIALLPIKFNLPMVCKPKEWTSSCKKPRSLSDLTGGYLSGQTDDLSRYRLLSSNNINNYYIDIKEDYNRVCNIMNKLQGQPFKINSKWLYYINDFYSDFVDSGLLMPKFLNNVNMKEISTLLREFYMNNELYKKLFNFNNLLHDLHKDVQRAHYENLVLKLAMAYDGYKFYLPVFLDFRGRIYRSGIINFHERDLARSLIVFADSEDSSNFTDEDFSRNYENVILATAFHYKSFATYKDANIWFDKYCTNSYDNTETTQQYSSKAKRPFQFLSNITSMINDIENAIKSLPITQDASASAYQIMSYFLLDKNIAIRTNLISRYKDDDTIHDIYSYILEELKVFIKADEKIDSNLSMIVIEKLDRKIVKGIFMPIIYGKTVMSTACDLREVLSQYITHKESFILASSCFRFWKVKYHNLECLIRLIQNIGWLASARDRAVVYNIKYFSTVQDYMKMIPINIWVYDRVKKKRRKVTLRVSSNKRDRRKTETSTFVNFIHQRDAYIAMRVVECMLDIYKAPVYTVHDNFISTSNHCNKLSKVYREVIREMGSPLSIINEFIYMNVIQPLPIKDRYVSLEDFSSVVISKETLEYYLTENIPKDIKKKERVGKIESQLY